MLPGAPTKPSPHGSAATSYGRSVAEACWSAAVGVLSRALTAFASQLLLCFAPVQHHFSWTYRPTADIRTKGPARCFFWYSFVHPLLLMPVLLVLTYTIVITVRHYRGAVGESYKCYKIRMKAPWWRLHAVPFKTVGCADVHLLSCSSALVFVACPTNALCDCPRLASKLPKATRYDLPTRGQAPATSRSPEPQSSCFTSRSTRL